jgi:hypothetical protein
MYFGTRNDGNTSVSCNIMTTLFQIITFIIATLLLGCGSQPGDTVQIKKTSKVIDTPQSLVKNYGISDTTRLFAFVGEKISVEPIPSQRGSMDNCFKAKYVILKRVYGNFSNDTIEFIAYDHYGIPPFSKFKNALLYVSADSGTYYHQKYMYNDVYKTNDGRWAGTYASDDYGHGYNRHTNIKPVKIDFATKVSFPLKMVDEQGRQLEFSYPKPYFKIVGDSAFAVYGNYVEDLVTLKKTGVLTSRGIFEATAEQEEDMVEASQPEPKKTPPTADDLKFLRFWQTFIKTINEKDFSGFKAIALDTLYVCDNLIPTTNFIKKCFDEIFDQEVLKRINDKSKIETDYNELDLFNIITTEARSKIIKIGKYYRLSQMLVTRSTKDNNPPTIHFDFIETNEGYRLYCIDHHWFKDCCK